MYSSCYELQVGLQLSAVLLHLEIFRDISWKLKNGNVPLYYSCHELQVGLQLPAFLLYLAHSSGIYSGNLPLYYSSHELLGGTPAGGCSSPPGTQFRYK